MKRDQRVLVAQETLKILADGFYLSPGNRRVSIGDAITHSTERSVLYAGAKMPTRPIPAQPRDVTMEVTAESTFAALSRLSQDSQSLGCLNFASAKNPGGGFLSGAEAQEEAITRASGLYPSLLGQPDYYRANRAHSSCLYLDMLILSPEVPFFRDDSGGLIEQPVLATVVTAPAPNAGAVRQNEPHCASEIEPCLQRRAEFVLRAFALAQVETLVLGAWGCGVFRNDPHTVAASFATLLGPSGTYSKHFKKIVFAIYDPTGGGKNLTAFREVFSDLA